MADEGFGASLSFGTSGTTLDLLTIQAQGSEREDIPTFHHGTTTGVKSYIPGDLREPGTVAISWLYDPNIQPPEDAAAEQITITSPTPAGGSGGATEVFTGYVKSWDGPSMEVDAAMVATGVLKRAGKSVYTDATT